MAIACQGGEVHYQRLQTAVTNLTASVTNSTAGTAFTLDQAQRPARLYFTAYGTAATTNGSAIVKLSTSFDGTTYDTAAASSVKVTMSTIGVSTNTVSDWFELSGVKSVRVGQIENTHLGPISNLQVHISWGRE